MVWLYLLPRLNHSLASISRVLEMSCGWSERMAAMLNWLMHSASNSFRRESAVPVRHLLCCRVYGCYKQTHPAPVMSCGCSRFVPACFCGLTSSRKVSGVPWASGIRRVSAGLEASVAHWPRHAALTASLSGSDRKRGGRNGSGPSCPVDGLCPSGTPLTSCAFHHCSICTPTQNENN